MTFAQDLRDGIDEAYAEAGVSAQYTDIDGATTTRTVIVDFNLSTYGDSAEMNYATAVIAVRVSEQPLPPQRGETFLVDTTTYRVSQTLTSDELEHTVLVAA